MRVAILFGLVLCAAAAQAEIFDTIYGPETLPEGPVTRAKVAETIKHATNDFVQKAISDFHKVQEKFNNIAKKIRDGVKTSAGKTKQAIEKAAHAVEAKVKEITAKGKRVVTCLKLNWSNFKDLKQNTLTNIKTCAKGLYEAVVDFEKNAAGHSTDLVKSLGELVVIVGECVSDNVIAASKCALKNIDETKKTVTHIVEDFKGLIQVAREKSEPLIKSAHECKEQNFASIAKNFKDVENKILQCVQN